MNRSTRDILFIFMGLFLSLGTLWASKTSVEARLGRDVAYLNTLGRSAAGEKSLTLSLESLFMANAARIKEMRRARLGYGDISVALALASHLTGGITRANVQVIGRSIPMAVVIRRTDCRYESFLLLRRVAKK
jgi:hypothetical protein